MGRPAYETPRRRTPLSVPFFYGWVVLSLSFLTTLIAAGIRSSPQVLIHPLEAEFGWNRAAIGTAVGLNLFLYGAAAPVTGWLLDRIGPRLVMLGSLVLLVVGVGLTTFMKEFWQLVVLWGVVIGLGAGASASVLAATVANRWFIAHRGLALGILNSATSTGQLIFIPVLMAVIVFSGWRAGTWTLVAAALALMPFIALWMRDDPAEVGLEPLGAGQANPGTGGPADPKNVSERVPVRVAFRSSTFWMLAGSFFICGATSGGLIGTHLIPHSIDYGIPEVVAAATVGVMGGLNFVGTVFAGWAVDRFAARKLLSMVYALRGLSLFILPFVTSVSGLFLFAVIYGLDWFASVPPTIALTADSFGKRSVGSVFGWVFLSHQVGAAFAAAGAGMIRVSFGDYRLAFLAGGVLAMIGAALAFQIRKDVEAAPLAPVATGAVRAQPS